MTCNYGKAFNELLPGAKWVLSGADEWANYEWYDERPQPSQAECDAIIPTLLANFEYQKVSDQRRNAYEIEADPLFFVWQRGEGTEQAWLDKIVEIRDRFPHVTV
jgi:hypothetical protein